MSPKSLSKSEQREWRKLSRSPNKLTTSSSEGQHSQPSVRSAERDKSHAQERCATISPVGKEGPKRMSFEHEQAKSPLASYFVGPSQFWVVNIPRHDVLARFCRYSVKSNVFIVFNLLLHFGYFSYFFFKDAGGSNIRTIVPYVGLAIILDAVVLEPVLIFLKALLAYSVFKMSNSEYHLWFEEDRSFAVPSSEYSKLNLSYSAYLRKVTGKPYKPLTSAQLDEKRRQQKLEGLLVLTAFYVCLALAGYCLWKQLSWGFITVEWIYVDGLTELLSYSGISSIGMNNVVNLTTLQSYIIYNYMFVNNWYQWSNHRNISNGGSIAYSQDRFSVPLGPLQVITSLSAPLKRNAVDGEFQLEPITEDFVQSLNKLLQYERETWELYKDSDLITSPIWLGGKMRRYMKVFNGSVIGKSGESYPYEGYAWTVSLTPFSEYYTTQRLLMEAISAYDFPFVLHFLILGNYYMSPYMPGISFVGLVIEQLPSGLYTVTVRVSYSQAGDFSEGKSLYPSLTYRRIVSFLAVGFFGFNVYFLSKFGHARFFGDFRWIYRSLFLIVIFFNTYYSAYHFPNRFRNSMALIENHFMGVPVDSLSGVEIDESDYDRITSGVTFLLLLLHAALFILWYFKLTAFNRSLAFCAHVALIFTIFRMMTLRLYAVNYQHVEARKIFLYPPNWSEIQTSFDRTLTGSPASLESFRAFFLVIVLIVLSKTCTALIVCKFQSEVRQTRKEETGIDETQAAFQFIKNRCSDKRNRKPDVPTSAKSSLRSSRPSTGRSSRSPNRSLRPSPGRPSPGRSSRSPNRSLRPSPGPSTRPSPGRRSTSESTRPDKSVGWLFRSILGPKFNFIAEKK